ncbi:Ni/Fe hydrogenase subunit alpha [bacterium]|nr:Ni/Fe hydrogenase subunit alpha [bacterium]
MGRRVTIDPITRLEGHGKIEIFLDKNGDVENAYFQVPELRGFEKFSEGRMVEEMPRITPKICGVCPTAHHMAATKALDDLYKVEPTRTARLIRELIYNAFTFEDHAIHFYFLGGPDFVVGPTAPKAERNILGVIGKVGLEVGGQVIDMRHRVRNIITTLGGRVIHPVCGLPGGVSRGLTEENREEFTKTAADAVEFAKFTLQLFADVVLKKKTYVDLIVGDIYKHETYYMGLVNDENAVDFYDGMLRVVTPDGKEFAKFKVQDYLKHISEHVESWSYVKFPFLKKVGWKGFVDGPGSGVYRVAPLARLNASEKMRTSEAQAAREQMFETLGFPAHNTLAYHWARLIEIMQAAERMVEIMADPDVMGDDIRNIPTATPTRGIGVVEAPRGTLIHDYTTDERGIVTQANLLVATVANAAPICMSVERAARGLIKGGEVNDGLLNMVEMAFRAYDPCFGCATHSLPGQMPLEVVVNDADGNLVKRLTQFVKD